ncbi:hypothetical protein [Enterococcus rotai]|uniref:hypothetical protein n=1 Tax=Enterococcus rotai TaxID=118060 RepID=UPI0032B50463
MKKHIVFIVNDYLPYPSANGICVSNIVEVLKNKYEVTILCQITHCNQSKMETIEDTLIFRCSTKEKIARTTAKNRLSLRCVQVKKYLKDIFSFKSIDKNLTDEFLYSLEEISTLKKIDYIIPVCFPFESIVAAIEFSKTTKSRVIPLLFDKFAVSNTRHRNKINKFVKFKANQRLEIKAFEYCEHIISSLDWKNYLDSIDSDSFEKSYIQVPTLVPNFVQLRQSLEKTELVSIIFAGNVSNSMRPIDRISEILLEYNNHYSNIKFNFYGNGDNISSLKKVKKKFKENIHIFSSITLEELRQKYIDADILCSIGNVDVSQTPSKIFEYISTGKPILHFYRKKEDPVIKLLSNYEHSMCINQNDDLDVQIRKLHEFSIRNHSRLSFDEIRNTYFDATPQYAVKKIEEIILKGDISK